jgi:hypothetical protein
LVDEESVTITATETLSELSTSDIEIISKNSGMWNKTKLISGERLYVRRSYNFEVEDSVVVIDVTKKPWVKQLGSMLIDGSVQFGDTADVVRRHFVHIRCKSHITIVKGSKYCGKCKQIIVPANMCYLSYLSNDMLKNKNFILGEMLVDNVDNKVLLIDMECARRDKNVI